LLYADLDRFKEFNDSFGFVLGDEAIRVTAQVLAAHLDALCSGARLGHLGGDDFVIVAPDVVDGDAVARLCAAFDDAKRILFDEETLRAREFLAVDRRGVLSSVPVTTLSIAVVPSRQLGGAPHPALIAQVAAALKKKAKDLSRTNGRSSFVIEQRVHER
jgi:diguanylate cyclase (GGDEF)-like protein